MAYLYSWLSTFDGVVNVYNSRTPLRGKRKAWDIRPLGKRTKAWERIIKVDDNTYVLCDGWVGNTRTECTPESLASSHADALAVAPIIWTRKADGDYVKIRTSFGSGAISRYNFLHTYTPPGMSYKYNRNGVHWVETGGSRYLLPKSRRQWREKVNTADNYLEFKVVGDGDNGHRYELVSEAHKKTVPVVNRELTKQFNPKIKELWEWTRTIMPVFGDQLHEEMHKQIQNLGGTWSLRDLDSNRIRCALDNVEGYEQDRFALAFVGVYMSGSSEDTYSWDAANHTRTHTCRFKETKTSYNRFRSYLQRQGGMMTTKEVDFE